MEQQLDRVYLFPLGKVNLLLSFTNQDANPGGTLAIRNKTKKMMNHAIILVCECQDSILTCRYVYTRQSAWQFLGVELPSSDGVTWRQDLEFCLSPTLTPLLIINIYFKRAPFLYSYCILQ